MVLIYSVDINDNEIADVVSVPLRGLWFLSYPTLINESGLYSLGFRPLAGIMVLIKKHTPLKIINYGRVSVPLRGLWFLSAAMIFM